MMNKRRAWGVALLCGLLGCSGCGALEGIVADAAKAAATEAVKTFAETAMESATQKLAGLELPDVPGEGSARPVEE